MKRRRSKMAKRHRQPKPDEFFTAGPLRVARFGKNIVYQTNWAPEQFDRMQREIADRCETIVSEIDDLVEQAATLISQLPPLELLHRAWYSCAAQHLGVETEVDIGPDEALAMRMFDGIELQLARMTKGEPPQAMSCFGEIRMTALPWAPPLFPPEHDKALALARATIAAQGEAERTLIEPIYFDTRRLVDIRWRQVSNVLFSAKEQQRLQRDGSVLRARRVRAAGGKTRPNEPCPCGSGRKFKKCHGR